MEEQLSSGLGEGQVSELVEDDEVAPGELLGGTSLAPGAMFGLEQIDQVDGVVAAPAAALPDAGAHDGDGKMGLAAAGSADQDEIVLSFQEGAG